MFGKVDPLLLVSFTLLIAGYSLVPDNSCVVDGSENVKELVLDLEQPLIRPATSVPTEEHVVLNIVIKVTIGGKHIVKLIGQTYLWEQVLEEVAKWIFIEEIEILIYFLNILVSEAVSVDHQSFITVKSALNSSQEPMS